MDRGRQLRKLVPALVFVAGFGLALTLGVPSALADRTVRSNEPIVWFDDVTGSWVDIRFPESGDAASDDNRSGLGDETNPGEGEQMGRNGGTDNPNQKGN